LSSTSRLLHFSHQTPSSRGISFGFVDVREWREAPDERISEI